MQEINEDPDVTSFYLAGGDWDPWWKVVANETTLARRVSGVGISQTWGLWVREKESGQSLGHTHPTGHQGEGWAHEVDWKSEMQGRQWWTSGKEHASVEKDTFFH